MGKQNSLFSGKKAGDVKDLFFNLIDCLLTELKSNNSTILDVEKPEEEDEETKLFKENKREIDNNIINKLFLGYYETLYYCPKFENEINYAFQTESFILFELENIKKYFNKKELSIELCFNYYYRNQKKSSFYCNKCSQVQENTSKDRIYRPPEILVIILDRGKGKIFDGNVIYYKYMDLKNIINEKNIEYSTLYQLICISSHHGTSSSEGHYTATCLIDNKDTYYYFNDKKFWKIKDDKELLEDEEPYILFYKKIDNKKKDKIDVKKIKTLEIKDELIKDVNNNQEEKDEEENEEEEEDDEEEEENEDDKKKVEEKEKKEKNIIKTEEITKNKGYEKGINVINGKENKKDQVNNNKFINKNYNKNSSDNLKKNKEYNIYNNNLKNGKNNKFNNRKSKRKKDEVEKNSNTNNKTNGNKNKGTCKYSGKPNLKELLNSKNKKKKK